MAELLGIMWLFSPMKWSGKRLGTKCCVAPPQLSVSPLATSAPYSNIFASMAPVSWELPPFTGRGGGFRHMEKGWTEIQVTLCYLKWNAKREGRQQVKREPQTGFAGARPVRASSHFSAHISTRCREELRSSLSRHGSARRSSRRPHRAAALRTCCDPAPDHPHRGRPGGAGLHGRLCSERCFWISVCQHAWKQKRVSQQYVTLLRAPSLPVSFLYNCIFLHL